MFKRVIILTRRYVSLPLWSCLYRPNDPY